MKLRFFWGERCNLYHFGKKSARNKNFCETEEVLFDIELLCNFSDENLLPDVICEDEPSLLFRKINAKGIFKSTSFAWVWSIQFSVCLIFIIKTQLLKSSILQKYYFRTYIYVFLTIRMHHHLWTPRCLNCKIFIYTEITIWPCSFSNPFKSKMMERSFAF